MKFSEFRQAFKDNFESITVAQNRTLFEVDADKDKLWDIYLGSFPAGSDMIYRVRTQHDCSHCRHFIKEIGRVVYFDDELKMHSVFEFHVEDAAYQQVIDALDRYILSCKVIGVYLHDTPIVGVSQNAEMLEDHSTIWYTHLYAKLPDSAVFRKRTRLDTIGTAKSQFVSRRDVFKRSLDEISLEAIDTVLELIEANSLYRGEEWRPGIKHFKNEKVEYEKLEADKKEAYCWVNSATVEDAVGRIRNHSIGVLLTDISEGVELDEAVRRYESIVAPANYKRPKAVYSKRMLENAQKTVTELGYMDSLPRRHANLNDITVNNILFSNRDIAKKIGGNVFDDMMREVKVDPKKFSRAEEIGIEKFVNDVLPNASKVEAFVESRLESNFVSLIAPVNKDAKSMFKWDNGFSWAYSGNMTDGDIRENVKKAGGRVDGALRFSIQWNDTEYDPNDLDAHCELPGARGITEIYYAHKLDMHSGGLLDVDIINPVSGQPAVENIIFREKGRMRNGTYRFFVHCFNNRGGRGGFKAEIEFDGKIYRYDYNKEVRHNENVTVAVVTLGNDGEFKIQEYLRSEISSRDIWGVKTQTFVPVTVIMNSPNYWDDQKGIGHKHYFFMLKDCINPEKPNGFYNEFLKQELVEHKRVFEALGSKMSVEDTNDQLSGIGFSSTKRNNLIVKVVGNSNTERVFNIKF